MKKKAIILIAGALVLVAALLLLLKEKPFEQQFQETTANLKSYLLEGDMELCDQCEVLKRRRPRVF